MKLEIPEKPAKEKEQISMLWDAVYNHIPHWLCDIEEFTRTRFNFVFGFMALVLALLGVILGIIIFK